MSVYDWPFARYYWEVQRLLLWEDYEGLRRLAAARIQKPLSVSDTKGRAA